MQMSMSSNYAVRIILELAKTNKLSSCEISAVLNIPESYVMKLMKELKRSNLVISKQGMHGGFALNREIKNLTLFDIMNAVEPSMKINRCLEHDEFCSRCAIETCNIRRLYYCIQEKIEAEFRNHTIQALLEKGNQGE